VLVHDKRATFLPFIIGGIVVLTNDFGLLLTLKGGHPENIIESVQQALPKDMHLLCLTICNTLQNIQFRKD
jgi:hypothetical protein